MCHRIVILILFSIQSFVSYSQFTSSQNGDWDNGTTWGSMNNPGTEGVDYPSRTDDVIIGHIVTIDAVTDNNAGGGQNPDAASTSTCDAAAYTGCADNSFYHQGDITINSGGDLTSSVDLLFDSQIEINSSGTLQTTGDGDNIFLIGSTRVDVRNGGTFSAEENLSLSGSAVLNMASGSSVSVVQDDFYLDGENSFLCGEGTLNMNDGGTNNPSFRVVNDGDGMALDQVCAEVSIICVDGDCCGANCTTDVAATMDPPNANLDPNEDNGTTRPGSSTVLPVELVAFSLRLTDRQTVIISWTTATEINNDRFVIERSSNAIDFEDIAEIPGHGNTDVRVDYSYEDRNSPPGLVYYRLRQIDFDGVFEVFHTAAIQVLANTRNVKVYPNPVIKREKAWIELTGFGVNEIVTIEGLSIEGKSFFTTSETTDLFGSLIYEIPSRPRYGVGLLMIRTANGLQYQRRLIFNE